MPVGRSRRCARRCSCRENTIISSLTGVAKRFMDLTASVSFCEIVRDCSWGYDDVLCPRGGERQTECDACERRVGTVRSTEGIQARQRFGVPRHPRPEIKRFETSNVETVKVETVWASTSARTWIRPKALHIATVRRDPKLHPGRPAAAHVCRRRRGQDARVLLVQQDDFEIGRVGVVQPSNDHFCLRYQIQQGACTRGNACKCRVERIA